jgi:hypothetical protein
MDNSTSYYPLAAGNSWEYKMKDGKTYTNVILSEEGNTYSAKNSLMENPATVKKEGESYLSDHFEHGNFQVFLKDNLAVGDTWEVKFKANNFDNVLVMTVKETGTTKQVEEKEYTGVAMIEAESKMIMNDNLMSLQFFTQYYYAKGVGLILTTSSAGDYQGLVSYSL